MRHTRDPFSLYLRYGFHAQTHRTAFAIRFMQAFRRWQRGNKRRTFLQFVRLLDPTVPYVGYKFHKTYHHAENLKRTARHFDPPVARRILRTSANVIPFPKGKTA